MEISRLGILLSVQSMGGWQAITTKRDVLEGIYWALGRKWRWHMIRIFTEPYATFVNVMMPMV
jgi:hypothetical protein